MQNIRLTLIFSCLVIPSALSSQEFNKASDSGKNTTRAGGYGVDFSASFSQSDFQCIKKAGYDLAIVRAYRSTGEPDYDARSNIVNARAAGLTAVHVYMFPCPACGSPSKQVQDMVRALGNASYDVIWLDVEDPSLWSYNDTDNVVFFEGLLNAARSVKTTGVYTSASQWTAIMENGYTGGSSAPLWYSQWDSTPSFEGFKPFGGWTKPAMKQYAANIQGCGVYVDLNWY